MDEPQVGIHLIREFLKPRPNKSYVTRDLRHLCVLMTDGLVLVIPGDYAGKTPEEVSQRFENVMNALNM